MLPSVEAENEPSHPLSGLWGLGLFFSSKVCWSTERAIQRVTLTSNLCGREGLWVMYCLVNTIFQPSKHKHEINIHQRNRIYILHPLCCPSQSETLPLVPTCIGRWVRLCLCWLSLTQILWFWNHQSCHLQFLLDFRPVLPKTLIVDKMIEGSRLGRTHAGPSSLTYPKTFLWLLQLFVLPRIKPKQAATDILWFGEL